MVSGEATGTVTISGQVRRLLLVETVLVVAVGVGLTAARSVLIFVSAALAPGGLAAQQTGLNGSQAPGHPWVDLGLQLATVLRLLLPPAIVLMLMTLRGETLRSIGLRTDRLGRDVALGVGAAALVGAIGLSFYLASYASGGSLAVIPTSLPAAWWRIPVLVLSAIANSVLEEVVLTGYLVHRGRQLGWSPARAIATTAVIRGCYHLYQGFAGLAGNLLMGAAFARYFQRTGRIVPVLVAHAVIDVVAFCGYLLLAGHVSWLPVAR